MLRPLLIAAVVASAAQAQQAGQAQPAALPAPPSTAEEDAAFAVRVFAEQILKSERLLQKGAVTKAAIEGLRIQLTDAKIQHAIAQGSPKRRLVRLLKERIKLSEQRLARIKRLADRGVLTTTDLETARHDHRETLITLAAEINNRPEIVRLLQQQIAATTKQIEKVQRLSERQVVPRESLALERLHLARLKNRLASAEQQLPAEDPGDAT